MNKKIVIECQKEDKITEIFDEGIALLKSLKDSNTTVLINWFGVEVRIFEGDTVDSFATHVVKELSSKVAFNQMTARNHIQNTPYTLHENKNVLLCGSSDSYNLNKD